MQNSSLPTSLRSTGLLTLLYTSIEHARPDRRIYLLSYCLSPILNCKLQQSRDGEGTSGRRLGPPARGPLTHRTRPEPGVRHRANDSPLNSSFVRDQPAPCGCSINGFPGHPVHSGARDSGSLCEQAPGPRLLLRPQHPAQRPPQSGIWRASDECTYKPKALRPGRALQPPTRLPFRPNFKQPCSCGGHSGKGRRALRPKSPALKGPSPKFFSGSVEG